MRDNSEMANDHRKAAEPDYLYQQGVRGIWTYRRRIPTDLLHHFDGKREIVRSTKTSDYKSALLQSHQITDHYDKLFAFYRAKDSGSAGILERHRAVREWLSQHLPEALKAHQGDRGEAQNMDQISVKIIDLPGSVLSGNQNAYPNSNVVTPNIRSSGISG
jgi:hypothetical protein